MAQPRLRGQETYVNMLRDGQLLARIDAIVDFEMTDNNEVQEEEFLGNTAPEFDTVYNGTSFRLTIQLRNKDAFELDKAIRDKAKRRSGSGVRFDVTNTMFMGDGSVVTQTLGDVSFGATPTNVGGRKDFVTKTYEGSTSDVDTII